MKYLLLAVLLVGCTPEPPQQNQHCLDYNGARFGRAYAEEVCK